MIYYYYAKCVNCPAIAERAYADDEMEFIENCECGALGATLKRVRIVEEN